MPTLRSRYYRRSIAALSVAPLALAAMAAVPAHADPVKSGNKNSLTLGGQVSRAMLYADDGNADKVFHVDNENDSTRIFLAGEGKLNPAVTFGANIVMDVRSNPSSDVTIETENGAAGDTTGQNHFTQRNLEFYIDHSQFGRLTLGQGETASDDLSEIDLSETAIVGYSQIADMAGSIKFRTSGGGFGPSIGDSMDNLDGNDRGDRIRWDSPEVAGLTFMASHVSDNSWDVGLAYAGGMGDVEVEAGVAYWNQAGASTEVENGINGSIAVRHASGLNATFAAANRNNKGTGRKDSSFYYGKVGYIASLNSLGPTAFSVDYGNYEDISTNGDDGTSIGIQAVQHLEEIGSQIFIGYRFHELDRPGTNFDDVHAVMTGVFVSF